MRIRIRVATTGDTAFSLRRRRRYLRLRSLRAMLFSLISLFFPLVLFWAQRHLENSDTPSRRCDPTMGGGVQSTGRNRSRTALESSVAKACIAFANGGTSALRRIRQLLARA